MTKVGTDCDICGAPGRACYTSYVAKPYHSLCAKHEREQKCLGRSNKAKAYRAKRMSKKGLK
jgi:hypothetical protein